MRFTFWTLVLCLFLHAVGLMASGADDRLRLELEAPSGGSDRVGHCVWEGAAGRSYFVQSNTGLGVGWGYLPVIVAGADRTEAVAVPCSGGSGFFRLVWVESDLADPWAADFDGDRVSNGAELLAEPPLDPLDAGSADADAVPDDWERFHFGSEHVHDGMSDPDADAAGNLAEFQAGTDPDRPDHPLVPLLIYHAPN